MPLLIRAFLFPDILGMLESLHVLFFESGFEEKPTTGL